MVMTNQRRRELFKERCNAMIRAADALYELQKPGAGVPFKRFVNEMGPLDKEERQIVRQVVAIHVAFDCAHPTRVQAVPAGGLRFPVLAR